MPIDYWRQLDIVNMDRLRHTSVTVIGAGGIGTTAALALGKMGVGGLVLYDHDRVEEHNLPNQLHRLGSEGKMKAQELGEVVKLFSETEVEPRVEMVKGNVKGSIVISAVDTMRSREEIWQAAVGGGLTELYIDARMGGEMLRLYTVRPQFPLDQEAYEATLYSDEEALELPCTAQSIIYTTTLAGALVAYAVKRHVQGEGEPIFEVVLDIPTMILMTREAG